MLRQTQIDPTTINNSTQATKDLVVYLTTNTVDLLEKRKTYQGDFFELKTTRNLVLDKENTDPNIKRYHVISNEKDDILGDGAFSRTRGIIGYIDVNLTTHDAKYTPDQSKAVRISNRKYAEQRNQATNKQYQHQVAIDDYNMARNFSHLGMQEPIEVKKEYAGLGLFSKSYSVMNLLEGDNLDIAMGKFYDQYPDTFTVVDVFIIPLIEIYKKQIVEKGYVHRDIRVENVRARLDLHNPILNFLDFDSCLKPDANDNAFGTPGYLPPEVFVNGVVVTRARDMFQLGVLLIGCLNDSLDPVNYFQDDCGAKDGNEVVAKALEQLKANGCYDPDKMLNIDGNRYDLFDDVQLTSALINSSVTEAQETQERDAIKALLKEMTNAAPDTRPDIDTVIARFKTIRDKLNPHPQATATLAAIDPTSSSKRI